jgi:hypothetical protein
MTWRGEMSGTGSTGSPSTQASPVIRRAKIRPKQKALLLEEFKEHFQSPSRPDRSAIALSVKLPFATIVSSGLRSRTPRSALALRGAHEQEQVETYRRRSAAHHHMPVDILRAADGTIRPLACSCAGSQALSWVPGRNLRRGSENVATTFTSPVSGSAVPSMV